jgi:hypothetical protein
MSILSKGLVVNSREREGIVEGINAEPLDFAEIAKLWKGKLVYIMKVQCSNLLTVYTTIKRRLLDPTAERLENYW